MSPKKKLENVSKKIETLNLSPKNKKTLICLQKKKKEKNKKKNPSLWELLKIRNKQAAHTGA